MYRFSQEQLKELWEKYDTENVGALNAATVSTLATQLLQHMVNEKWILSKYVAAMINSPPSGGGGGGGGERDRAAWTERKQSIEQRLRSMHHRLVSSAAGGGSGGGGEEIVTRELLQRLNFNPSNGCVGREEFISVFAIWIEFKQQTEVYSSHSPHLPAIIHSFVIVFRFAITSCHSPLPLY